MTPHEGDFDPVRHLVGETLYAPHVCDDGTCFELPF